MNIEEQVLSREQMAHLKELGVDTSDASICWVANNEGESEEDWYLTIPNNFLMPYNTIPTYTIGDLIEKLPKKIGVYELLLDTSINDVKYVEWIDGIPKIIEVSKYKNDSSLKDSLYEMLCWVSENHKELIK